ncbi:MAG: glycosyltransferase family 2 protein [Planctomycetota bacterium]
MERSLTVLLPVRDAQATLARNVAELLEVVPELTGQFELLIVDDGSTDATPEVAQDLGRYFPQVRLVRLEMPRGRDAAIRTGLERSSGEIVFVRDEAVELGEEELRNLWCRASAETDFVGPKTSNEPQSIRWITRPEVHRPLLGPRMPRGIRLPRWSHTSRPNYLARLRDLALGE